MSEYGYKFQEYEKIIKLVDDAIIDLTSACLVATDLLQKMQARNFDLRGKVAELASSEIKKMREQVDGNQKDILSRIDEVREKVAAPCKEPIELFAKFWVTI